jgi:ribosome-associated protein
MNIRKMKSAVIDALEEIKAKNIVVLNVAKLTAMFEYIVVATGDSNRQTRALANNVRERLKEAGATIYGSEGEETGEWVLVDLGDIVVHVMQPAVRDYYRLEELWRDGKIEYPKAAKEPAAPSPGRTRKAATGATAASGRSAVSRARTTTRKGGEATGTAEKQRKTGTKTLARADAGMVAKGVAAKGPKAKPRTAAGAGRKRSASAGSGVSARVKKTV